MPIDPLVIDSGALRHVVTIQSQQTVQDISGTSVAWKTFATARAAIVPMRGVDLLRNGQDISQEFLTVTIRWQPGITAAMRLLTSTGTYTIQAVDNVQERNRRLNLTCVAMGANE